MSAQQFSDWKRQLLENPPSVFETPDTSEEIGQIVKLKHMLERLTIQLEIAKEPLTSYVRPPAKQEIVMRLRMNCPVIELCVVLDCARSSLYYQSA